MVSKRQRRVKSHRKARDAARAMIDASLRKMAQYIRERSFKSLPADMQKEIGASWSPDKVDINREHDMPGQVGDIDIGAYSCKDAYEKCFPEDLDWASERLKKEVTP